MPKLGPYREVLYVRVSRTVKQEMERVSAAYNCSLAELADHALTWYLTEKFEWERPVIEDRLP